MAVSEWELDGANRASEPLVEKSDWDELTAYFVADPLVAKKENEPLTTTLDDPAYDALNDALEKLADVV